MFIKNESIGLAHYIRLVNCDLESLNHDEMSALWRRVRDTQVKEEVDIIKEFMNKDNRYLINQNNIDRLIDNIKNFCNRR